MEKKEETKDVYITYGQIYNDIIKDDLIFSLMASICHHMEHFINECELFDVNLSIILSYVVNTSNSECGFAYTKTIENLKKCNRNDIIIYRSYNIKNMQDFEYYRNSSRIEKTAYYNFLRLVIAYSYYWTDHHPCSFETLLDHTIVSYSSRYNFIYLPFKQPITIFLNEHSKKVNIKIPTIKENKIEKKSNFWKRLFHKEKPDTEFRLVVINHPPKINIKF